MSVRVSRMSARLMAFRYGCARRCWTYTANHGAHGPAAGTEFATSSRIPSLLSSMP